MGNNIWVAENHTRQIRTVGRNAPPSKIASINNLVDHRKQSPQFLLSLPPLLSSVHWLLILITKSMDPIISYIKWSHIHLYLVCVAPHILGIMPGSCTIPNPMCILYAWWLFCI